VGKDEGYESMRNRITGEFIKPEYVMSKGNEVYDSIRQGDTGMLTYKERANIDAKIKKDGNRYKGRLFISFEKDSK